MTRRSPVATAAAHLLDWRVLLSVFFCLMLALAPSLAEARGGGGKSSFGSRGSRTFENNSAAPITRSANPAVSPGTQATRPMAGGMPAAAAAGGSFFQRHPFLTGLTGGLLGAALFSSLGGMGHFFGGILQFLIIGLLIFLAIRLARSIFGARRAAATGRAVSGDGQIRSRCRARWERQSLRRRGFAALTQRSTTPTCRLFRSFTRRCRRHGRRATSPACVS